MAAFIKLSQYIIKSLEILHECSFFTLKVGFEHYLALNLNSKLKALIKNSIYGQRELKALIFIRLINQRAFLHYCLVLFLMQKCTDILLNRSQQLFSSCTAKFADGQQCSVPVFDITHQTPLCEEHAKKMVSTKTSLYLCALGGPGVLTPVFLWNLPMK